MSARNVVITGCGVVSAIGIGRDDFAAGLAAGRCGIGEITGFDASAWKRERAAEIAEFDAAPWLRSPKNYLDRNSALAFAASEMAIRQSGLALPNAGAGFGVSVGSLAGNMESLALFDAKVREKGPKLAPPIIFPHTYYNTTAGLLSIEYGLTGPHGQFCSGAAAGLEAILFAAEQVRLGFADVMLTGGAEALNRWLFALAAAQGWLSPKDGGQESCRPFDKSANGTILGEGAAFIVVESAEFAAARGAKVLARVTGVGFAANCLDAMRQAVVAQPAGVFASANGCREQDEAEVRAIAEFAPGVAVTALKAQVGETCGASGPLSIAAALAKMGSGQIASALVNASDAGGTRWACVGLGG